MSAEVRVRYAPSPTGEPHIGNIRTALFNWLFARHHGGRFVVRIEDTDQGRLVPGAVEAILDGLRWMGIAWDEGPEVAGPYGPYLQSQRLDIYARYAAQLLEQGDAYRCWCSREQLQQFRQQNPHSNSPARDSCRCRTQGRPATAAGITDADEDEGVIRFAMPTTGISEVRDLIRGEVEWRNELQDDFIIIKSDGFPTYHLAVVADDHLMRISHIMRAEEWLPSTPRHLQLYRALGLEPPYFAHLPMITGADRAKLSKRHGATAIGEYREQGYLPEALRNFMVLLGWSLDGSSEVLPLSSIIENFTLDRITKSAAVFDQDKLLWMNGVYIRELPPEKLAARMKPFVERRLPYEKLPVNEEYLGRIALLLQERIKRLDETPEMAAYFFQEPEPYDPALLVQKGMDVGSTAAALAAAGAALQDYAAFDRQGLEVLLTAAGEELGLSRRQFFGMLRVAATGRTATPPLFEMLETLGRERTLHRLQTAAEMLTAPPD